MIFEDHVPWPPKETVDGKLVPSKIWTGMQKEFNEAIGGRWPVTLAWAKDKVRKSADPNSNQLDQPPGTPIKCQWSGMGPDGKPHVYTYATDFSPNLETRKNDYSPRSIMFPGSKVCEKNDRVFTEEFLIFLFNWYPELEGGKASVKGTRNLIRFDLPHVEMKKNAEYDKLHTEAMVLITDRKHGLTMPELKEMATSYFIPNVDTMEDWEVEGKIKAVVFAGKTPEEKLEPLKLFLFRNKNKAGIHDRYLIQKSIEAGFIKWNPNKGLWNRIVDNKPVDPPLCMVKPNENHLQKLYETMTGAHQGVMKELEYYFDGGKKKPVEPIEKEVNNEDEEKVVEKPPRTYGFQKKVKE